MMQERELLEKSKQGDSEAFNQLINPHRATIFHLCLRMVKNEAMAEDLTQETLIKAYQKIGTFEGRAKFSTWLYRIAHNLAVNQIKKHKTLEEQEFKEALLYPTESSSENEELQKQLQRALIQLPLKQREVFELYVIEEKSQKEIAALLNIPLGTVRSRLFYAKRALRSSGNFFT